MAYTRLRAADVPSGPGPHPAASPHDRGIGHALGLRAFGLYQVELPPGGETVRHDHRDDRAEDAYVFLTGTGCVIVDGEELVVEPGDFVAVTSESTRQVRAGDNGLVFLAVCASMTD